MSLLTPQYQINVMDELENKHKALDGLEYCITNLINVIYIPWNRPATPRVFIMCTNTCLSPRKASPFFEFEDVVCNFILTSSTGPVRNA